MATNDTRHERISREETIRLGILLGGGGGGGGNWRGHNGGGDPYPRGRGGKFGPGDGSMRQQKQAAGTREARGLRPAGATWNADPHLGPVGWVEHEALRGKAPERSTPRHALKSPEQQAREERARARAAKHPDGKDTAGKPIARLVAGKGATQEKHALNTRERADYKELRKELPRHEQAALEHGRLEIAARRAGDKEEEKFQGLMKGAALDQIRMHNYYHGRLQRQAQARKAERAAALQRLHERATRQQETHDLEGEHKIVAYKEFRPDRGETLTPHDVRALAKHYGEHALAAVLHRYSPKQVSGLRKAYKAEMQATARAQGGRKAAAKVRLYGGSKAEAISYIVAHATGGRYSGNFSKEDIKAGRTRAKRARKPKQGAMLAERAIRLGILLGPGGHGGHKPGYQQVRGAGGRWGVTGNTGHSSGGGGRGKGNEHEHGGTDGSGGFAWNSDPTAGPVGWIKRVGAGVSSAAHELVAQHDEQHEAKQHAKLSKHAQREEAQEDAARARAAGKGKGAGAGKPRSARDVTRAADEAHMAARANLRRLTVRERESTLAQHEARAARSTAEITRQHAAWSLSAAHLRAREALAEQNKAAALAHVKEHNPELHAQIEAARAAHAEASAAHAAARQAHTEAHEALGKYLIAHGHLHKPSDPEYKAVRAQAQTAEKAAIKARDAEYKAEHNVTRLEKKARPKAVRQQDVDAHPFVQHAQADHAAAEARVARAQEMEQTAARRAHLIGALRERAAHEVVRTGIAADIAHGGPGVHVHYAGTSPEYQAESKMALKAILGRHATTRDLASMLGARPGDVITVSGGKGSDYSSKYQWQAQISIDGHQEGLGSGHALTQRAEEAGASNYAEFSIAKLNLRGALDEGLPLGSLVVDGPSVRSSAKGMQSGHEVVGAVRAMQRVGVARIHLLAAGNHADAKNKESGYNGYNTWAKLGARGTIPASVRGKIQELMGKPVTRVEQVMASKKGQAIWKRYGDAFSATMDLYRGGRTDRVIRELDRQMGRRLARNDRATRRARKAK